MHTTLQTDGLLIAATIGAVLQVAMVIFGHGRKPVQRFYAVGGMGISLLAGCLTSYLGASNELPGVLVRGGVAGGLCALIGIFVSYRLRDVPASLLLLGTLSSVVTGVIGAALWRIPLG